MKKITNPERLCTISNFETRLPNKSSLLFHSTMEIQILFQHWDPQNANYGFGTDVRGNAGTFRCKLYLTEFACKPVDKWYF